MVALHQDRKLHSRISLENTVHKGPYYLAGAALARLSAHKLYQPEYPTFEAYCKAAFGYGEVRAKQLIRASEVVWNLRKLDDQTDNTAYPASESEARQLVGLSAEQQRIVWAYCLLHASGPLTTDYIKSVADQARRVGPNGVIRFLTVADVGDQKWPSRDDLEIPSLLPELQASALPMPLITWGSRGRKLPNPGSYHFYTDDSRFMALWEDPTPIVNSGCETIVEPNFSIHVGAPRIVGLHHIYLKRWLSRYWQSHGLRVFVDLNVAPEFYLDNLRGVPAGWRAYATRGSSARMQALIAEYEIAAQHAGSRDLVFLVVGGGQQVRALARARGWLYSANEIDQWQRDQQTANEG